MERSEECCEKEVAVENEEVAVETEEVAVENEEVAVETEEVAVENEEVAVETEEVAVETEEVAVETEEVAVENEEIAVETEEVAVETEEVVDENKVVVETEEVAVETEEVVVENKEVAVETEEGVVEMPAKRKSARIEKMKLDKGKKKMSKEELERDYEIEKSNRNELTRNKKRKVVENVTDRVEHKHWVMVNGKPHVIKDVRSKEQKRADVVKVMETLRLFEVKYQEAVLEENTRCEKETAHTKQLKDDKKEGRKCKNADTDSVDSTGSVVEVENRNVVENKGMSQRPDLKTIGKMKEINSILFPIKMIGSVPGINVGDRFSLRAEMCVIGIHRPPLSGIDYMGKNYRKQYKKYNLPLAVSVVVSGLYQDDEDDLNEIIYTGQGGNNLLGNKLQVKHQEPTSGNLALKNCIEQCTPVRLVRGHESMEGKVYTYDGLYQVSEYWFGPGKAGFDVFKFRLRRLGGQPKLVTTRVNFAFGKAQKPLSNLKGLICEDIRMRSVDSVDIPIPATNVVDDACFPPPGFVYIEFMDISKSVEMPSSPNGCNCRKTCTDPNFCSCAALNDHEFPYLHSTFNGKSFGYRLIKPRDVVYECGPGCGCGPDCVNRASQRGIEYRLEVFRTSNKGWGVRSRNFIPSGALVCEYIGVLKRTDELDCTQNDEYIFEIDCVQTMKGLEGRQKRYVNVSNKTLHVNDHKSDDAVYCIDAASKGNVSRFINHSCEPNMFVQCVLSSHREVELARIMLVAGENIYSMQELTYDYGYVLDSVVDSNGKPKQLKCHCEAANCRKRLY